MRLNQYIAAYTKLSRRQADEYIQKGLVEVNGELGQLFHQVENDDKVRVYEKGQWQTLGSQSNDDKHTSILFYKPIFAITSKIDPQKRKTIYHFLPKIYHQLKPAGRLDYMSEGLLILSNDGQFLQELTHPRFESEKEYLVGLDKILSSESIKEMQNGFTLDDYELNPVKIETLNTSKLQPFSYLKPQTNLLWYKFRLTEGRHNEIRRMCEQFGHKVQRLIRIKQGDFVLTEELYDKKLLPIS